MMRSQGVQDIPVSDRAQSNTSRSKRTKGPHKKTTDSRRIRFRHNIPQQLTQLDEEVSRHIDNLPIELPRNNMRSIWKKHFNVFKQDMFYSFKTINPVVLIGGLISLPSKLINLVFNFYKDVIDEYPSLGLANKFLIAPVMTITAAAFVPEIALLKLTEVVGKSLIEIGKGNGFDGMYTALSGTMKDFNNQLRLIFNLDDVHTVNSRIANLDMSQESKKFLLSSAIAAHGIEMLDESHRHDKLLTKAITDGMKDYIKSTPRNAKNIEEMPELLNRMLQSNQKVKIDISIFQDSIKDFFIAKGQSVLEDTPNELLKLIVTSKLNDADKYKAIKSMTTFILTKQLSIEPMSVDSVKPKVWSQDVQDQKSLSSTRSI